MLCKKTQGKLYTFRVRMTEGGRGGGGGADSILQSLYLSWKFHLKKKKKKKPADLRPQG